MEDQILDFEERDFNADLHVADSGKRFVHYLIDHTLALLYFILLVRFIDRSRIRLPGNYEVIIFFFTIVTGYYLNLFFKKRLVTF